MSTYGTYGSVSSNPFGTQPAAPASPSIGDFSASEVFGSEFVGQPPQEFENIPISSSGSLHKSSTIQQHSQQHSQQHPQPPSSPPNEAGVNPFAVSYAIQEQAPSNIERESLIGLNPQHTDDASTTPTTTTTTSPSSSYPWNLSYYTEYFNVESVDVVKRIVLTVMPWKFNFFSTIATNPDVYGPFWTTTTLVFIIAVSSDIRSYFLSHSTHWHYDITKIIAAAAVMYGYTIALPIILWIVLRCMDARVRLLEVLCLYGYAVFVFIPCSIVCTFTYEVVKWVSIIVASSFSGFFILSNIFALLKATHMKRSLVVLLVLGALHVGVALTFLFYFFGTYKK